MHKNTLFHNLLQEIPRHKFGKIVKRHQGDRYVKHFTCFRLLLTLLYAQIRGAKSFREIVFGLMPKLNKLYHIGLEPVKRSTLSDALLVRDCRIFEEMFYELYSQCQDVTPKHKFRFKNPLYSMDSTTIDLCLSVFDWAKFRKKKGAIKIHFSLDHGGMIPNFLVVTEGKRHDVTVAKNDFPVIPDSISVFDRAYLDYNHLYYIHKEKGFFVTRIKKNTDYIITGQHEITLKGGVLGDYEIEMKGFYTSQKYPEKLRLVRYYDAETGKIYEFLTNNFRLSAKTIADIYKERWQIELFFKWIKQNLKIKTFLGTSKNAVMIQIWVAMIYYLLLAYIKHQTKYSGSYLELHRLFKEALFDAITVIDLLNLTLKDIPRIRSPAIQQMPLF